VSAVEPTRLLVVDWVAVNRLMQAHATFAERLESVARERLATL
jgi:hypothetical protein